MALRRGIVLVLTLIGLAVLVSITGMMVLYVLMSRGPAVPERATLVLRPGGELRDRPPDDVVAQVLNRDAVSLRSLLESVQKAKRDSRITTLLLRPSTLETPFWAKVQELRDAVVDFRESGKEVVAYLEYGGEREYYLASAADRVFLMPTSPLDLTGIASYEMFLRGALDRLGAYPDFLQIGPYKTAPNQLTERGFTPAHREMAESLNRDLYDQLVEAIADARGKTVDEVRQRLDEGPLTAEEARQAGFVDDLAYLDQLDDRVEALNDSAGGTRLIEGSDYQRISPRAVGFRPRSRIAMLYASGIIVPGRSRYDAVNGPTVGSETIVEQIQRIRDDDAVRAIVLRVDSPGGSAVASDVIWRELMITKEENTSRPLVVSMSDLAASGGYYISMPAHAIVAEPATFTGSIGIFGGKIVLDGTMDKLGIGTATVQSGRNADIYSPFAPFTPDQRARLMSHMETFYDGFVRKAAAARGMSPEQIDAVAQGRVWTGRQAREHGLVDALGGLDEAVAIAKERAGIPADEDVELVVYPPRRTLYEALAAQFQASSFTMWSRLAGGMDARALATLVDRLQPDGARLGTPAAALGLFRRGEPLALMPAVFLR